MATEEGVFPDTRQRLLTHWVKKFNEVNGDDPRYNEMARQGAKSFADALLSVMDLQEGESEIAVHFAWMMSKHINDPHDYNEIWAIVDFLQWRRSGYAL